MVRAIFDDRLDGKSGFVDERVGCRWMDVKGKREKGGGRVFVGDGRGGIDLRGSHESGEVSRSEDQSAESARRTGDCVACSPETDLR